MIDYIVDIRKSIYPEEEIPDVSVIDFKNSNRSLLSGSVTFYQL